MKLTRKEKAIFAKGCAVGAAKQKRAGRKSYRRKRSY